MNSRANSYHKRGPGGNSHRDRAVKPVSRRCSLQHGLQDRHRQHAVRAVARPQPDLTDVSTEVQLQEPSRFQATQFRFPDGNSRQLQILR